jgi:hypothetical protein
MKHHKKMKQTHNFGSQLHTSHNLGFFFLHPVAPVLNKINEITAYFFPFAGMNNSHPPTISPPLSALFLCI